MLYLAVRSVFYMREKQKKIISYIFFAAAAVILGICIWDVCICGLFAPAVDITHGVGVAAVCAVFQLSQIILFVLIGLDICRDRANRATFQNGLLLVLVSILTLIFSIWGQYFILPALFGIVFPIATAIILR